MTTFTDISDEVLEPGKPIRSVDVLALRDNTNYNHENTVLEILQEDIFTTSGSFTKASGFDPDDTVMIFLVGGGGSGGAFEASTSVGRAASGGGPGETAVLVGKYSEVTTSPLYYVLGAGGAAIVNQDADGIEGNISTLHNATPTSEGNRMAAAIGGSNGGIANGGISITSAIANRSNFVASLTTTANARSQINYQSWRIYGQPADPANNAPIIQTFIEANNGNIVGAGGSAARDGATDRPFWNKKQKALFPNGGLGSGTASAQNATGFGGGGGGCCSPVGTTPTSGAGGNGALVVRYYRGRVTAEQVIVGAGL